TFFQMENLLKRINYRHVNIPESNFSFYILNSSNLFYIYLNNDQVSFKDSTISNNGYKGLENVIRPTEEFIETLLEGYGYNGKIFLTDVYFYNGNMINQNFSSRYILLTEIANKLGNNVHISRMFSNITLEDIYNMLPPYAK